MEPNETLRDMWLEYAKLLPPNASPSQVIETRRGFYAGAWALFIACQVQASTVMPEADMNAWLDALEAEFQAFKKSVGTPLEGRE